MEEKRHDDKKQDLKHLQAALQNQEKELWVRQQEAFRGGDERSVQELRIIFDDFERCLANIPPDVPETYHEGLRVLKDVFVDAFKKLGVVRIPTVGRSYDPKFHEGVAHQDPEEGQEPFSIIDEVASGWMWQDNEDVIVPAKVKIIKG